MNHSKQPLLLLLYVTLIYRLSQLDWLKALHKSKQEGTSESKHETCIHPTIQRQQRSAGKHADIPEQLLPSRHAVQLLFIVVATIFYRPGVTLCC